MTYIYFRPKTLVFTRLPPLWWPTQSEISFYLLCLVLSYFLYYFSTLYNYHRQRMQVHQPRIPPRYPSYIPWLGSALPFLFSNAAFLQTATSYAGRLTSTVITVAGKEFYLFQDIDSIRKLWKKQCLSSPIPFYVHVLRHFFGMHEGALATYQADNSGAYPQPFAGSNVKERNRLDFHTHTGFKRAFTGAPLAPTAERFRKDLVRRFDALSISDEWVEMPDFLNFFRTIHGAALLQSIFGPSLMEINPDFVNDVWVFDDSVPWLSRMIPSFINPAPYRARQRVRDQLKKWYSYARKHFNDNCIYDDGDGDPYWGSELIRYQQKMYLAADNYDDDALASADLALVWGTVGNAIPTTMLSVYHIFKDPALLERVRVSLDAEFGHSAPLDMDLGSLIKDPLLSSVQAEVLRLYVSTCVMVTSPHTDVSLGKWWMPRGGVALVNSGITHMDSNYWNTRDGLHPVRSFWADRFLVDPHDPSSGPVQPKARDHHLPKVQSSDGKPAFSLQGLEASWMPYGGGNAICPGRFLSKRVTLFTIAFMVAQYDVEFQPHNIKMGSWKYGMGVEKPKEPIPFRIRKRAS